MAIAVSGLIIFDRSLTPTERGRILVIFISAFFVIFFWAAFEQAGSSLTLFAERNVNRAYVVNTQLGSAILFLVALAAVLYYFLQRIMLIPVELRRVFGGLAIAAIILAIYHYIQRTPYNLKEIPASWFNSVNSMWLILVAPFLSQLWQWMGKRTLNLLHPKTSTGFIMPRFGLLTHSLWRKRCCRFR
ncbi:hypothetical protein [Paraflavitalea speifideaquila]|uniref:hypothetical protein n=1 Tax=Paraflavitalea speifideaquila TaxID=3076558 RepID=UPI0028EE5741|nr:hypothetical protein [Paraflavitalea speifideiaquila]